MKCGLKYVDILAQDWNHPATALYIDQYSAHPIKSANFIA
jgi:hypothetical protein